MNDNVKETVIYDIIEEIIYTESAWNTIGNRINNAINNTICNTISNIMIQYQSYPLVSKYMIYITIGVALNHSKVISIENDIAHFNNKYSNALLCMFYLKLNKRNNNYNDKIGIYSSLALEQGNKHIGYQMVKFHAESLSKNVKFEYLTHSAKLNNAFAIHKLLKEYREMLDIHTLAKYLKPFKNSDNRLFNDMTIYISELLSAYELYEETKKELEEARQQIEEMELSPLPGRQYMNAQKSFNAATKLQEQENYDVTDGAVDDAVDGSVDGAVDGAVDGSVDDAVDEIDMFLEV